MTMTESIAQTIGNYRIEELLGDGELGQVFRARNAETEREVALKVMRPSLAADANFRARFEREVAAVAAICHPNIAEIYDWGEHDRQVYVAIEYLPDGSLCDLLQRQPAAAHVSALAPLLDLARQAADVLTIAHARGVIHRAIKPSNLLIWQPQASNGTTSYAVKVADFGLVRLAEDVIEHPETITLDLLAYTSPEWFQGLDLDERSDIYALGVVLYEIATGYLPFEARTLNAAIQKHCFTAPLAPRKVRADLPAELEALILRCLAKAPAERFANAAELSSALVKVQRGLDLAPPPDLPAYLPAHVLAAPSVRALNQQGGVLQVVELTGDGVTVGRGPGNDMVLPSEAVLEQHLQIDWDGNRVSVTALAAGHNTLLEGVPLSPQAIQYWSLGTMLRIGPYWLLLEPPAATPPASAPAASQEPPADTPAAMAPLVNPLDDGLLGPAELEQPAALSAQPEATVSRISMTLDRERLSIEPGRPAMFKLTLANLGSQVDHFTVTVEGVPASWIVGSAPVAQLNPGKQDPVMLNIAVPVAPESRAGDYPVTIRARSRENPKESGAAAAIWTVLPFAVSALEIRPRRIGAWRRAVYTVTVRNMGNAPARYALAGADEEEELDYRFAEESVALAAGQASRIRLKAYPRKLRWFGSDQRHSFTVSSKSDGAGEPEVALARLDQRPLLPSWFLRVAPLALLAVLLLIYLFRLLPSLDKYLVNKPAYAALRTMVPTAAPTAPPTFAPINIVLPTALPTSTPTATPEPTATPAPTAAPAPPTATPAPPTPIPIPICAPNVPFKVEGKGPPNTPLLASFDQHVVSGGSTKSDGRFAIWLRVGQQERSGAHTVTVRQRNSADVVAQLTCIVPTR